MSEFDDNILNKFQTINRKLEKKFMRRINLAEPSDHFSALAGNCEKYELYQYAGLCWSRVVNCEDMRNSPINATVAAYKAASYFVTAHMRSNSLGCIPLSDEYMQAAMNYYNRSISLVKGQELEYISNCKVLCVAGKILSDSGRHEEAARWLQNSINFATDSPSKQLCLFEFLISECIKAKNFVGALYGCSKLINLVNKLSSDPPIGGGIFSDILAQYEVTIILLLMILKPNPRKLPTVFSNILEKYTWIDTDSSFGFVKSMLPDKLFFLIQSLVMSCQINNNLKDVCAIEKEIITYLTEDQKNLYIFLINSMS